MSVEGRGRRRELPRRSGRRKVLLASVAALLLPFTLVGSSTTTSANWSITEVGTGEFEALVIPQPMVTHCEGTILSLARWPWVRIYFHLPSGYPDRHADSVFTIGRSLDAMSDVAADYVDPSLLYNQSNLAFFSADTLDLKMGAPPTELFYMSVSTNDDRWRSKPTYVQVYPVLNLLGVQIGWDCVENYTTTP